MPDLKQKNSLTKKDTEFLENYNKIDMYEAELEHLKEVNDTETSNYEEFRNKSTKEQNLILNKSGATKEEYQFELFNNYKDYSKLNADCKRLKTLQDKKATEQIEAEAEKYETLITISECLSEDCTFTEEEQRLKEEFKNRLKMMGF